MRITEQFERVKNGARRDGCLGKSSESIEIEMSENFTDTTDWHDSYQSNHATTFWREICVHGKRSLSSRRIVEEQMLTFSNASLRNSSFGRLIRFVAAAILASALSLPTPTSAGYSASWQSVATAHELPFRTWTAMTWVTGMDRIVIWGGWGETFLNDMYAFDPVAPDWQMIEPYVGCPGITRFDIPNGSDESGVVYDPINDMLWIVNGGSGYRCNRSRTAGTGTTSNTIVDTTLASDAVDFYTDFQVSDLSHLAVVTAYDPATRTLSLDKPLALAAGSSYQLFADAGAGTWSYSFATGTYSKLEARHWGYTGQLPSGGQRFSPGFASNGSSYAILFGGVGGYNFTLGAYDNSTWKLDFGSKSYSLMRQMGPGGPAARAQIENQFVYDSLHDRFILFGGQCRNQVQCGSNSNVLNDTWIYDPQANLWTELHPPVSPPPRSQGQMYFDSASGVVVLYGGANISGTALSDLWVFNLATQTWTQVTTTGTPTPMSLGSVAYVPTTGCGYLARGTATYQICINYSSANTEPVANIAVTPATGSVGTVFGLDGAASFDPDGTIVSYAWNFGDGTSANGALVHKSYSAVGSYPVTLTVTDNLGATGSRTTTITVSTPPTASLTSPGNGATFAAPATVALDATAADSDGIARVDFYRGTTLIGSDTSAPYTWSDTVLAAGTYSYTAVAYDNLGASTTSAAVTVTVTASTTTSVNVASAANGGVATASSFYNANYAPSGAINGNRKGLNWGNGGGWNDATASSYADWLQVTFNATQTIGEIDVFTVQDNYSAPVEPTSSMTFSLYGITSFQVQYWDGLAWTDVPGGNVTGNNLVWRKLSFTPVTTDRIRVIVNSALASYSRITEIEAWTATSGTANTPPTVSLSSPANGATFTAPATVSLAATAADSDGTVSRVDFYRGTALIGSDTSAPYTLSDTGLAAGTYTYSAVAFDNAGASTSSTTTTITISTPANAPPTISLTSPTNGATFTALAAVPLAATAADSDGTVSRVDFYRGTTLIGSDTSAPYTWSDTGLAAGTYSYTAVAYDNLGASTTSAAVTITVTASATTSVNVAAAANGGVATASSFYSANYAPSGANNGNRKGLNWGNGGGWNDATASGYPDWLQVTFSATQTIGEIDVFTVQDNYSAPVEPTSSMTFTQYGITDFQVQYWDSLAWTDVPGGNVTGNNLVWRKFTFTPITTDRIRVLVNGALASYSRITEIEAWTTTGGTTNVPPTVSLTSPANGAALTAPAAVSLAATAADSDGTVSRVDFYRGTALIGSDTSAPYTWSDNGLAAGTYSYTAVAYDNLGASTTSAAVTVTVTASATTSVNVAAAANGGVATASSFYSANYSPSGAINGNRKGLNWGNGGGWNDATDSGYPDWLQVTFRATQTIGEIDVFTVQNNYSAPVEPTSSMTFTQYGVTDFQVQYWDSLAWTDVPGGNVTGNNLVWRQFTFTPVTTDRIRVLVNGALASYSRITEIEAWTTP